MFKQRLQLLSKAFIPLAEGFLRALFLVILLLFAINLFITIWPEHTEIGAIFLFCAIIGGMMLYLVAALVMKIYRFIYWLFIEPYKNWRSQRHD